MEFEKNKINKRKLVDIVKSEEEFIINASDNINSKKIQEYSGVDYNEDRDEEYQMEEDEDEKTDEELEYDISGISPTRRREKRADMLDIASMTRAKNQVGIFTKLPSGITPYEIMYGPKDDDFDLIGKSLE